MYVCLSSYKVPVILAILMKLEFPRPILKKCQISNFMKILSVGAAFFSADGRTDGQAWQSWWSRFTILPTRLKRLSAKCLNNSLKRMHEWSRVGILFSNLGNFTSYHEDVVSNLFNQTRRFPPKVSLLWRSGGACAVRWSWELHVYWR